MNKKKILIIAVILIIIILIIVVNNINASKIEYEIKDVQAYNYFKYIENGKTGVIDREGNIIINAEYQNIDIPNPEIDVFVCTSQSENQSEETGAKNKILNSNNEELFSKYDNVEVIKLKNIANILCFEKSVLKYEKDGKYGLIDFSGKEITKNIYTSIENLQGTEGKLLVSDEGKYGVINIKGKVLVKPNYDKIETDGYYDEEKGYIKSGFIVSNKTDDGFRYGYINYKGSEILKTQYNEIIRIPDTEEIYLIASENGKYGLYEESKEIIEPQYQSIVYEDNGVLIIQKNKSYGIANLKGQIKVNPIYDSIEQRGMYLYAQNSSENTIYDASGNVIDMNFNKVLYETENEEYRISTILNNDITYYGIENKDGKTLVNEGYRYLEYVYKDYFIAKGEDGKLGVINANGKVMVELEYDLLQKIKGKNALQVLDTNSNERKIYSYNLELSTSMKNATLENENDYIKLYNNKEAQYFDNNGNKVEESSDTIQNALKSNLPNEVGEFKKVQNSLDNVYYSK